MKQTRKTTPPEECGSCSLPDCRPSDPLCPLSPQKKVKQKKSTRRTLGVAPVRYKNRNDYMRQYKENYRLKKVKVAICGIKLRRDDKALLERICKQEGRTVPEMISKTLEAMLENAREAAGALEMVD